MGTPIDDITLRFNETGLLAMNITIAFIMFGVALGLRKSHFTDVIKNPRGVIVGLISQFLLLPAVTFLIVWLGNLPVSISLGMILVASCPGGNLSNFMSSLANGNVALSVTLTAFSDVASVILTPINFMFWAGLYISTLTLANPIEIPISHVLQTIFLLMGLPLLAGMLFQNKFPKIAAKIYKPLKMVSVVIFFAFVIGALAANFDYFIDYIWIVFPIVLLHNLIAFSMGFLSSTVAKLPFKDKKTIIIETGIQNSGIALVLIFNHEIFPSGFGGVAFVTAWWGVWHIVGGLSISAVMAKFYTRGKSDVAKG